MEEERVLIVQFILSHSQNAADPWQTNSFLCWNRPWEVQSLSRHHPNLPSSSHSLSTSRKVYQCHGDSLSLVTNQSVLGCSDFLLRMQIIGNHWIFWTWGRQRQHKWRARRQWPSCRKPGGEPSGFACSGFGRMRYNSWGRDEMFQNATFILCTSHLWHPLPSHCTNIFDLITLAVLFVVFLSQKIEYLGFSSS